ncbi:Kinetochore-associated protein 1 [Quaeritorhiza haematococci]|nr:Kinetochore-associated protein 1 [Quaeritorhiza haematococci]
MLRAHSAHAADGDGDNDQPRTTNDPHDVHAGDGHHGDDNGSTHDKEEPQNATSVASPFASESGSDRLTMFKASTRQQQQKSADTADAGRFDQDHVVSEADTPTGDGGDPWTVRIIRSDDPSRLDFRPDYHDSNREGGETSGKDVKRKSVYKVETLVCLENNNLLDGEGTNPLPPGMNAVASPSALGLIAESRVYLFDTGCSTHLATINFDCTIDTVTFNLSGSFLLVGDSLGTLHFVHTASRNVVFSQNILEDLSASFVGLGSAVNAPGGADAGATPTRKVFKWMGASSSRGDGPETLHVVLTPPTADMSETQAHNIPSGPPHLATFSNIDFPRLESALIAGDVQAAFDVRSQIGVEVVALCGHGNDGRERSAGGFGMSGVAMDKGLMDVNDAVCVGWGVQGDKGVVVGGKGELPLTVWGRRGRSLYGATAASGGFFDGSDDDNGEHQSGSVTEHEDDRRTVKLDGFGARLFDGADVVKVLGVEEEGRGGNVTGKYLIVLDSRGRLGVWDSKRLVLLRRYTDANVTDFQLAYSSSSSTSAPPSSTTKTRRQASVPSATSIVFLTAPQTDSKASGVGGRFVHIAKIPTFETLYRVEVDEFCVLVRMPSPNSSALGMGVGGGVRPAIGGQQDLPAVYFLEGNSVGVERGSAAEEKSKKLYLRSLSETVPMKRFQYLIRTRRFEEAEEVAKTWGLERQFVLKAKLTHILSELKEKLQQQQHRRLVAGGASADQCEQVGDVSEEAEEEENEDKFVEAILKDLREVHDDAFRLNLCLHSHLRTYRATRTLLLFARDLVHHLQHLQQQQQQQRQGLDDSRQTTTATPSGVYAVHQALRRLGTFRIVMCGLRYGGGSVNRSASSSGNEQQSAAGKQEGEGNGKGEGVEDNGGDEGGVLSGDENMFWVASTRTRRVRTKTSDDDDADDEDDDDEEWFDGSLWQRFRIADLGTVVKEAVRRGDVATAGVIWRRHCLDENLLMQLHDIIAEMPDSTPAAEFIPWLRNDVLPFIQRTEDRARLGLWIEQRARIIETKERRPHNALEVVKLLDIGQQDQNGSIPDGAGGDGSDSSAENDAVARAMVTALEGGWGFGTPTPLRYVQNTILFAQTSKYSTFGFESTASSTVTSSLRGQLMDLVYLWDQHQFHMTLTKYCQVSPQNIAIALLERVAAAELLPTAIQTHFLPYVARNELNSQELMLEYCKEIMELSALSGRDVSNALWEDRVLAIIGCMETVDAKADATLEVMRRTPIPWSERVDTLIHEMLRCPSLRRYKEIQEQYRLIRLKRMLIDYGITKYNLSDLRMAKGLLKYIIGRVDVVHAMRDALQVVNAYHHLDKFEAYAMRLRKLAQAGKIEQAVRLLKTGKEDGESLTESNNNEGGNKPADSVGGRNEGEDDEDFKYLSTGETFDRLTGQQALSLGQGLVIWLVEIMNQSVNALSSESNSGADPAAIIFRDIGSGNEAEISIAGSHYRARFGWAVRAAAAIVNAIVELRKEVAQEDDEQSHRHRHQYQKVGAESSGTREFSSEGGAIGNSPKREIGASPNTGSGTTTSLAHLSATATVLLRNPTLCPASATISSATYATDASLQTFDHIKALYEEYHVMISPDLYRDEKVRRVVLRDFAKKVFTYGRPHQSQHGNVANAPASRKGKGTANAAVPGDTYLNKTAFKEESGSITSMYRLAELLGYEVLKLKGIIAEEAASCGDFKTALLTCLELYEKSPNAETAKVLRTVSHMLTEHISKNRRVLRDMRDFNTNYRLTNRILQLSQKALSVCDEDLLNECLDDFKNFELLHQIFTLCDAGDYELLTSKDSLLYKDSLLSPSSLPSLSSSSVLGTGSSSSSSSSSTSSSSSVSNRILELGTEKESLELATIKDSYGAALFEEHFQDLGLVLNTEQAMELASRFILDARALEVDLLKRGQAALDFLRYVNEEDDIAVASMVVLAVPSSRGKEKAARTNPVQSGHHLFDFLRKNKNHLMAMRVFHHAFDVNRRARLQRQVDSEEGHDSDELLDRAVSIHDDLFASILTNVMSFRLLDRPLALGLMLSSPQQSAFEIFKVGLSSHNQDFLKVAKLARVGEIYGTLSGQRSITVQCNELMNNANWWHQFKLFGMRFDHEELNRCKDASYQRQLIPTLLKHTGLDILTALEFARSYHIEDDFVIFEYIRQLLTSDENAHDYRNCIVGVVEDVVNRDKLYNLLLEICRHLSPYDYERLNFTLSLILHIKPEDEGTKGHLVVLEIISDYKRTKPPTFEELIQAKKSMLRVPVTEPFLSCSQRSTNKLEPKGSETRTPQQQDVALAAPSPPKIKVADLKPLLIKLEDLSLAVSTALDVSRGFPSGLDKIYALRIAVSLAERWKQVVTGEQAQRDVQGRLEKLRKFVLVAETEHQLRMRSFTDLLEFVKHPPKLLYQLYYCKSEQALLSKGNLNLHEIASDIAKRHGINIKDVRQRIIQEWLGEEVRVSEAERELYLPSLRVQLNNVFASRTEIGVQMRLLYVFRSFPIKNAIAVLIDYAYKRQTSKVQTLQRLRALSLLLQMASPQQLAANNTPPYNELKRYMQMLLYLADFEELNIIQHIKDFSDCDKEALARSLWVNHGNEPKVVQLICNICLDFEIWDSVLWENALRRLHGFGAHRYLLGILEHIASVQELSQMALLPLLWNGVLLGCLGQLHDLAREYTVPVFERVVSLIPKCPFLDDIQTERFMDHFKRLFLSTTPTGESVSSLENVFFYVRGLAALPPDSRVRASLKKLFKELSAKDLILVLDVLCPSVEHIYKQWDMGVVAMSSLKGWIAERIYDIVDERSAYADIQSTRFASAFLFHLIKRDRMGKIVSEALKSSRLVKFDN